MLKGKCAVLVHGRRNGCFPNRLIPCQKTPDMQSNKQIADTCRVYVISGVNRRFWMCFHPFAHRRIQFDQSAIFPGSQRTDNLRGSGKATLIEPAITPARTGIFVERCRSHENDVTTFRFQSFNQFSQRFPVTLQTLRFTGSGRGGGVPEIVFSPYIIHSVHDSNTARIMSQNVTSHSPQRIRNNTSVYTAIIKNPSGI